MIDYNKYLHVESADVVIFNNLAKLIKIYDLCKYSMIYFDFT